MTIVEARTTPYHAPTVPILVTPYADRIVPWTDTRDDRRALVACTRCPSTDPTGCDPARPGWTHRGRRWDICPCSPGSLEDPLAAGGWCRPTLESIDDPTELYDDGEPGVHMYRGACLGCGWAGPKHEDDQDAVGDAHDHARPGWRDLPVMDPAPIVTPGAKGRAKYDRWLDEVVLAYQALGWPEEWMPHDPLLVGGPITLGGPVRSDRVRFSTCSHYDARIGGYAMWSGVLLPNVVREMGADGKIRVVPPQAERPTGRGKSIRYATTPLSTPDPVGQMSLFG